MTPDLIKNLANRFLDLYDSDNKCVPVTNVLPVFDSMGIQDLKYFSREVYRQYTEKYSGVRRLALLWWAGRKDHPYSLVPEMISAKVCGEKDLKPESLLLRLEALGVYEKLEEEIPSPIPASR